MLKSHIDVIQRAVDLLDSISLEDFQQIIRPHLRGSIGQHLRHVIDHYLALENGFCSGLVDYDQRNRAADIELSLSVARETLQAVQGWLASLTLDDLNQNLLVRSEVSLTETASQECSSTLAREIMFVSSHAIHHFSLISIIRSLQGQSVPKFFGYAPATISHLTSHKQCVSPADT